MKLLSMCTLKSSGKMTVLIFYSCLTHYHRLSSLKPHRLIISRFLLLRSLGVGQLDRLLSVSVGCNEDINQGNCEAWSPPTSFLVPGIHLLALVWLRSLFPCYLSTKDQSQLLKGHSWFLTMWALTTCHNTDVNVCWDSRSVFLWLLPLQPAEKSPCMWRAYLIWSDCTRVFSLSLHNIT